MSETRKTMADVFKDLTVLEQILDDLNSGKRVTIKKNDIVHSAVTRAANLTRNKLFGAFQMAKANRELALPESKILPKNAKDRLRRQERQEPIYRTLGDYFSNEKSNEN